MAGTRKSKKRLKIAVLIDVLYPYMVGGGQKRMYEVYRRLAKKHDVHFFTMHWDGMPKHVFQLEGITVHPICEGSELYALGRRKVMPSAKYAIAIIPYLIRNRFDIIDCNEFPFLHILTAKFLKRDAEMVITWHEVWKREYWSKYAGSFIGNLGYLIQKLCARSAERIIAVSDHTKRDILNLLGVDEKKVSVVPNGVDFDLIKRTPSSKDKSDIIFVGRLIPEKNVDLLLKAIASAKKKIPKLKGVIIGEGPELEKLISLRDELGLEKNVKFVKFLDEHRNVLSLMKSSKIFVTASIREGFGMVIIEAMACGLPVIAINHPSSAVPDLIENGGVLAELDAKEIGDEIIKILKKGRYRKKLSVNALKIAEKYDWEKLLKDLFDE